MAKKNELTVSNNFDGGFEGTKFYFDNMWREKHGIAMPDWLVNGAKSASDLRRMACFMQPDACEAIGREIHFYDTKQGRHSKEVFKTLFSGFLEALGFTIYEKPVYEEPLKLWDDMGENERVSFAKAIWAKRKTIDGSYSDFPYEVKQSLCNIKKAPNPDYLHGILKNKGIDVDGLVKHD